MVFYKKPQPRLPENMSVENLVPEQDTQALQAEAAALEAMLASFEEGLEAAEHDLDQADENWRRASVLTGVDMTNMDQVTRNINARRVTGIDEAEVDEEMLERMKRKEEEQKAAKQPKMRFTQNGLQMVEDDDSESVSDHREVDSEISDEPMEDDSSTSHISGALSVDSSVDDSRSFSSSHSGSLSVGGSIDIDIDTDSEDENLDDENFFDWKMYRRESQQRLVRSLVPDLTELNLNDAETKELLTKNGVLRKSPRSESEQHLHESGDILFQWKAWRCLRDGKSTPKHRTRHGISPRTAAPPDPPLVSPEKTKDNFNENVVLEKLDMWEGSPGRSKEKFNENVVLEKLDKWEAGEGM